MTATTSRLRPKHLPTRSLLAIAVATACLSGAVHAQETVTELERIEVLGTRIRQVDADGQSPVLTIGREEIQRSGMTSIGEVLQDLTSGGKALSSQFNSSGNFGAPPDGGGIGAGSAQVDLRHLESRRVLVLVDGKRWVNESSASGVGGSVDLNTIPLAIVQAIEVLGDGASAIYGSDAIAGVINIVTRRNFSGVDVLVSRGQFEQGDGETSRLEVTMGGSRGRAQGVLSIGYNDQREVSSSSRDISRVNPAGVTRGSPITPQGRFIFVPTFATPPGLCPPTIDVTGDGVPDVPLCDLTTLPGTPVGDNGAPTFPTGFVPYTDDQSFNAQPYNLVLTPNRRKHLFTSGKFDLTDSISVHGKALYNRRESRNQAAPNNIVLGPEAPGIGIADGIGVSRLNPFNPFGVDLVPGVNMFAIGRRPVEGGPRIFEQDVETRYLNVGLDGSFSAFGDRMFYWEADYIDTRSEAEQHFRNAYNLNRIKVALGDPAVCSQTPGCVPLNIFGGMGGNGEGTITPAMLQWIRTDVFDTSDQELQVFSANLNGDLAPLPGGMSSIAFGVESRRYGGSIVPDAQRITGEVFDQAASTVVEGSYDVHEVFAEARLPVHDKLELSAAARYSDYSLSGTVSTGNAGFKWRPMDSLLVRGNFASGFRAPFLGELLGLSQFGASIVDPCSGFAASGNAELIANCQALGVPATYRQLSSQVFTTTGGNPNLDPETSESFTLGLVHSPDWAQGSRLSDRLDVELTYYRFVIDDAISAPDAQDVLNECVASGSPSSTSCLGIVRSATGTISTFDNRLANIGRIETDGMDVGLSWALDTALGGFSADWRTTYTHAFIVSDRFGNQFTRTVGVEVGDSAIPRWQSNLDMTWSRGAIELGWKVRFISGVNEQCFDAFDNDPELSLIALGLCSDPNPGNPELSLNRLGATTYHDLYAGWDNAFGADGLRLSAGINNAFGKEPPICLTCSLNGYDAGTYDVPGRFVFLQASYRFD